MSVKEFAKKIRDRKPWSGVKKKEKIMYEEIFSDINQKHLNIIKFSIIIFALTKGEITSINQLNAYQALWQVRELYV